MSETIRQRLRAALTTAMKARDQLQVRAIRDGLGAIDNAESVDQGDGERVDGGSLDAAGVTPPSGRIAGAASGVGATEIARRELTAEQMVAVVRDQVDERLAAAAEFDGAGAPERAALLRSEAAVLAAFLDER